MAWPRTCGKPFPGPILTYPEFHACEQHILFTFVTKNTNTSTKKHLKQSFVKCRLWTAFNHMFPEGIYIYIYIYMCVCVCMCLHSFWKLILISAEKRTNSLNFQDSSDMTQETTWNIFGCFVQPFWCKIFFILSGRRYLCLLATSRKKT